MLFLSRMIKKQTFRLRIEILTFSYWRGFLKHLYQNKYRRSKNVEKLKIDEVQNYGSKYEKGNSHISFMEAIGLDSSFESDY